MHIVSLQTFYVISMCVQKIYGTYIREVTRFSTTLAAALECNRHSAFLLCVEFSFMIISSRHHLAALQSGETHDSHK